MAQQLQALAVLPEDLGSILSTYHTANNHIILTPALGDSKQHCGLCGYCMHIGKHYYKGKEKNKDDKTNFRGNVTK